ncbi:MAG: iron ABC transporter permease [candidate division WOR-3 bacterium]|nr:iron ABC transporter permease [candidate division WOR-3 bacterium]
MAIIVSFGLGPTGFSLSDLKIPIEIRLPRIVLGIFAGGILSLVGATLQGLLQNPLVDPYTLGIASGASFGSVIGYLFGRFGVFTIPVFAFLGAFITIFLVYNLALVQGKITKISLVLAGVIMSFLFSGLVMLLMVLIKRPLPEIIYLLMGRLNLVFTTELLVLFIVIVILAVPVTLFIFSKWRSLNILSMNEEVAESLGVDTQKLTRNIFVTSSFLIASVVSFTGAISFIGLCVPHIVRMIYGPDHYKVLPLSFLLGASILIFTDLIARSIARIELPISVITALFGVPFFIYLLKKKL